MQFRRRERFELEIGIFVCKRVQVLVLEEARKPAHVGVVLLDLRVDTFVQVWKRFGQLRQRADQGTDSLFKSGQAIRHFR